jgi:hypothetical protein
MKLIDLAPRWVGAGGEGITQADGSPAPERHGVGITFICPCGTHPRDGEYDTDRCCIIFENPLDGGGRFDATTPGHYWTRVGETFETLSLTPSIQRVGGCGWHGFITNGEMITV